MTITVNQNAGELARVVGMLAVGAVPRFNAAGVQLLKKIMKQKTVVVGRQQIKHIARK